MESEKDRELYDTRPSMIRRTAWNHFLSNNLRVFTAAPRRNLMEKGVTPLGIPTSYREQCGDQKSAANVCCKGVASHLPKGGVIDTVQAERPHLFPPNPLRSQRHGAIRDTQDALLKDDVFVPWCQAREPFAEYGHEARRGADRCDEYTMVPRIDLPLFRRWHSFNQTSSISLLVKSGLAQSVKLF